MSPSIAVQYFTDVTDGDHQEYVCDAFETTKMKIKTNENEYENEWRWSVSRVTNKIEQIYLYKQLSSDRQDTHVTVCDCV